MMKNSNPPVIHEQLSAYMDKFSFDKHTVALSNAKLKKLTGYQFSYPIFNQGRVSEVVQKWKAERTWPIPK